MAGEEVLQLARLIGRQGAAADLIRDEAVDAVLDRGRVEGVTPVVAEALDVPDVPEAESDDRLESMALRAEVRAVASVLLSAPLDSWSWMADAIRFLPEWAWEVGWGV
ncbi:hypothetical protein ACFQFG_04460 [Methylobacterium persicinum]